jgi:hypothetical protein
MGLVPYLVGVVVGLMDRSARQPNITVIQAGSPGYGIENLGIFLINIEIATRT